MIDVNLGTKMILTISPCLRTSHRIRTIQATLPVKLSTVMSLNHQLLFDDLIDEDAFQTDLLLSCLKLFILKLRKEEV